MIFADVTASAESLHLAYASSHNSSNRANLVASNSQRQRQTRGVIYCQLQQKDGKQVVASVFQLLVLIIFAMITPLYLERTWPLDDLVPGVRRGRHYEFVSLVIALVVSWLIGRQSTLNRKTFFGAGPANFCQVMMAALLGASLFLSSITLGFAEELTRPLLDVELPELYRGWSVTLFVWKDNILTSLLPGHLYSGLATIVMAPITEECLYRGLLLRRLLATRSCRVAVLVSSLVFALSHIDSTPVYAFIGGLMLGMLYVKTASLWLVMIAHSTANLTSFLLRYSSDMYAEPGFTIAAKINAAGVVAISAIIVLFVTRYVLRYFERHSS